MDRRRIYCHIIIRDSESLREGYRDCDEGDRKGQTWQVGMGAGERALVTSGGEAGASWTLLTTEVRQGCWKQQMCGEEGQVGYPSVRGVQGGAIWQR